MKVNGTTFLLDKSQSLFEFLQAQNYDLPKIVVEHNGEIVPRTAYNDLTLCDEDTLEIVSFVGGG